MIKLSSISLQDFIEDIDNCTNINDISYLSDRITITLGFFIIENINVGCIKFSKIDYNSYFVPVTELNLNLIVSNIPMGPIDKQNLILLYKYNKLQGFQ